MKKTNGLPALHAAGPKGRIFADVGRGSEEPLFHGRAAA